MTELIASLNSVATRAVRRRSSGQRPQHPRRVAVNQVQQHQRRALGVAVATLPVPQGRHRHTKARREFRLGEAKAAPHGSHVHRRRAPHLHAGLRALGVADGLGQALLDAREVPCPSRHLSSQICTSTSTRPTSALR